MGREERLQGQHTVFVGYNGNRRDKTYIKRSVCEHLSVYGQGFRPKGVGYLENIPANQAVKVRGFQQGC